jgi:hypothetical protein
VRRTLKIPLILIAALGCLAVVALWWVAIGHASAIGSSARWLVRSHDYKAEVLAQPGSANRELKHVEWDGWGWAGQDTVVYVVFDPRDSLSQAAISHQPGKYDGIPCEVFLVRRLESHWYTVRFYTNSDWQTNC